MLRRLKLKKLRPLFWVNGCFLALILSLALFTELFYHQPEHQLWGNSLTLVETQIPKLPLEQIQLIRIANKSHQVTFRKLTTGLWSIQGSQSDLSYPAREDFVNGLISFLSSLSSQKKFTDDAINRSHYSLDIPLLQIQVDAGGKNINYAIGISNPLTNTSYLSASNSPFIYEVQLIGPKFMNFHESNLLDERLVPSGNTPLLKYSFRAPQAAPLTIDLNQWQLTVADLGASVATATNTTENSLQEQSGQQLMSQCWQELSRLLKINKKHPVLIPEDQLKLFLKEETTKSQFLQSQYSFSLKQGPVELQFDGVLLNSRVLASVDHQPTLPRALARGTVDTSTIIFKERHSGMLHLLHTEDMTEFEQTSKELQKLNCPLAH